MNTLCPHVIRSTSIQIGQLQEALNERKSAVNSLTAKWAFHLPSFNIPNTKSYTQHSVLYVAEDGSSCNYISFSEGKGCKNYIIRGM